MSEGKNTIQASELRIGNVIKWLDKTAIVTCNDISDIVIAEQHNKPHDFTPIPLSPEILEKCGFVGSWGKWTLDFDSCNDVRFEYDDKRKVCDSYLPNDASGFGEEMKYLHQVQNRYYCLVGRELEVNL